MKKLLSVLALTTGLTVVGIQPVAAQDEAKKPTADSQGMNKSDTNITAQIRRALVKDKALSSAAHNVKVITKDGAVTLRGRVNTAEEKAAVFAKAEAVAGSGKVTDELTVGDEKSK